MEKGYGQSDPKLAEYVARVFEVDEEVLRDVKASADAAGMPAIQVSPFDARLLTVLARAVGARRAVEIGTLAGYSAVGISRGMTDDGMLYTFEVERKHAEVARASLKRHGFEKRVQVIVGPALDHLQEIEKEGPFDLVFIDANKDGYPKYLAWAEEHLRIGGLVMLDNAFAFGKLGDPRAIESDPAVAAIHRTNERLARGGRFTAMMIPTGEGLAIGVKAR